MSNHFLSAKDGRIMSISLEAWSLLSDAFDDDLLTVEQDAEYLRLYDLVEGYANTN